VTVLDPDLRERVLAWIDDDPDPATRAELQRVLDATDAAGPGAEAASADLADRFAGNLAFGTAGLRGAIGAGPNRMNVAVVQRAAAGVAAWVRSGASVADRDEHGAPAERGVVIGFDARHRSRDFAEASAAVIAGAGITVHVLPEPLPTPVLAFAVRHLGTAAGIMVTASHNPPEDNGYKVYDGTGRQIVTPTDAEIATTIATIARVADLPLAADTDRRIHRLGSEVADAYVAAASHTGPVPAARNVRLASTALHGVGAATLSRALIAAGFAPPVEAATQAAPDPDFPTVAFPNPEEPGALDAALATAAASRADLLLANDPDADRLGAAIPPRDPGARADPAAWRVLRGDEIGVILADHLLRHSPASVLDGAVVATTIVSSTLLRALAADAGVAHVETLTGFKWLSRAAGPEQHRLFAYEEALGYCIGDVVGDKDGITAALVLAEAAALQAEAGRTLHDVLDDLARRYGVHATGQWSARVAGADGMDRLQAAMAHLRAHAPDELAARPVLDVVDLRNGDPAHGFPPSDVLTWHLDGGRVVVRPSGTEPKLKCYVEVVVPLGPGADLDAARAQAAVTLTEVIAAAASATGLA